MRGPYFKEIYSWEKSMKKIVLSLFIAITTVLSVITPSFGASKDQVVLKVTMNKLQYTVNGTAAMFDVAPYLDAAANRSMIPMRFIAEAFGAAVTWDDATKTQTIMLNGKTFKLTANVALPDGMGTPVLKNDRFFVPLRYVSQELGATVDWDDATQTNTITYTKNPDSGNTGGTPDQIVLKATMNKLQYTVNGTAAMFDVAPYLDTKANRSMIPMRFIAEAFGATVAWDDTTKTQTIQLNGKTFKLTANIALPNGMGTPVLVNDRFFVPLRYVSEELGATVDWDDATQTNTITYTKNSGPIDQPPASTYSLPDNFLINTQNTPQVTFGTKIEGFYTISDFCIMPDNSLLLMDSNTGKIYRFGDGKLIKTYDYNLAPDYCPSRIAADSAGNIYLLAPKYSDILKIDTNGTLTYHKFVSTQVDLGTGTFFTADSNNTVAFYCFNMEKRIGETYIVDVSNDTANVMNIYTGKIVGKYIFQQTALIDPGDTVNSFGHSQRIQFSDFNGKNVLDTTVTSKYFMLGLDCLGLSAGNYVLSCNDVDESNHWYNYLMFVNSTGSVVGKYTLPQFDSNSVIKAIGNDMYLFLQTDTQIQIKNAFANLTPYNY